jgi:hypothetical protein
MVILVRTGVFSGQEKMNSDTSLPSAEGSLTAMKLTENIVDGKKTCEHSTERRELRLFLPGHLGIDKGLQRISGGDRSIALEVDHLIDHDHFYPVALPVLEAVQLSGGIRAHGEGQHAHSGRFGG